jgi:hypothetical protein
MRILIKNKLVRIEYYVSLIQDAAKNAYQIRVNLN